MNGKKLLLIGQDDVLIELTKRILERSGCSVSCVIGLTGAEERLLSFSPDGIILDNVLSNGNGHELCRALRSKTNAPIMYTSTNGDDELPALQAGATDYLKKPYDNDVFKARLGVMLNMKTSAFSIESYDSELFSEENIEVTTAKPANKSLIKYLLSAAAYLIIILAGVIALGIIRSSDEKDTVNIPEPRVPLAAPEYVDENNEINGCEEEE